MSICLSICATNYTLSTYLRENEYSENTIRSYCYTIQHYFNIYNTFQTQNIRNYKQYLLNSSKISTANQRINAMNSYLSYTKLNIPKIKTVRVTSETYTDNVVTSSELEMLKSRLKSKNNKTAYFIIRYLASTGMRVSELLKIKKSDVENGYIDILSKGSKERRVFFPSILRKETLIWLNKQKLSSRFVFTNKKGNVLSPSGVRYLIKKHGGECGIEVAHLHPHAFRHRYAINFMEKTGNIALLSDFLGHSSTDTTRIYLRKSSNEQKELVDAVVNW